MQPTFLACTLHITADCGALPSFFAESSMHHDLLACLSAIERARLVPVSSEKSREESHGPGGVAHLHVLEIGMHSNIECCTHAYNPTNVPAMLVSSRAILVGYLTGMRMNRT